MSADRFRLPEAKLPQKGRRLVTAPKTNAGTCTRGFMDRESYQLYLAQHRFEKATVRATFAEKAASTDGLTGLLNADAYKTETTAMIREFILDNREPKGFVVVLFFDLDGFKEANDAHGHDVGDSILRRFAEILKEEMRAEDIVARKGGDEFTITARVASKEAGDRYIHRIHELRDELPEKLGAYPEIGPAAAANISFSFGLFAINEEALNKFGSDISNIAQSTKIASMAYDAAVKLADAAMYGDKAKKGERGLAAIERRQKPRGDSPRPPA